MASTYINIPSSNGNGIAQNVNVVNTPLPVTIVSAPGTLVLQYNEVLSVPSGSTTQIISYTVPAGHSASLLQVITSGENIAQYLITINGVILVTKRTYFGGSLNTEFILENLGYALITGDTVVVSVINSRPSTANFESTMQILLN